MDNKEIVINEIKKIYKMFDIADDMVEKEAEVFATNLLSKLNKLDKDEVKSIIGKNIIYSKGGIKIHVEEMADQIMQLTQITEELREGMTEKEYWFKSSEGHRKSATKYLNKYLKLKEENKRLLTPQITEEGIVAKGKVTFPWDGYGRDRHHFSNLVDKALREKYHNQDIEIIIKRMGE